MAKRHKHKPEPDRLPPHSVELEQGVIGCCLIAASCVDECNSRLHGRTDAFYDLRHQTIFEALLAMRRHRDAIEVITLHQRLKDDALLEQAGGLSYLSELAGMVPSAENLSYYLDGVWEKYQLRKIVATCTEVAGRVYTHEGDFDSLLDSAQRDLERVFDRSLSSGCETIRFAESLAFDTSNDPNNVIGVRNGRTTRFLCRGHSAWLIGPSGVGKSSLLMLIAVCCCLGKPFFGVNPQRPLRVMMVQAENDMGDLSEMLKGIASGLNLDFDEDAEAILRDNFVITTATGKLGEAFCQWLESEIVEFKADIVFVDPLLSFAGIDVGRTEQASTLCRLWLDPILKRTGAVLISNHHTGKPERGNGKPRVPQSIYDIMYSGIGSSELVNWARAVLILQPAADGENAFRLTFAKRGRRAWATHPNSDELVTTVWIRHATNGSIFWEQMDPPVEAEESHQPKEKKLTKPEQIATMNLGTFLSKCPKEGESLRAVIRRLTAWLASKDCPKRSLAQTSHGSLNSAVGLMLENEKLVMSDSLYFKGAQA